MATIPAPSTAVVGAKISAARYNADVRDSANFFQINSPTFFGFQSTAQTAFAASTWTPVQLNGAETIDRDGQHDTVTNNSRVVIGNTLGYYRVSGVVPWPSNATGTNRRARVYLNGVAINGSQIIVPPASTFVTCVVPPVIVRATASTDYVELIAFHDASTSIAPVVSGDLASCFTVEYIGS